jgi:uracil-DNA glycosylase family 4
MSEFAPWSKEWKGEQLYLLYELWKDCQACLLSQTRQNVVFGMGNPNAKLMFIGEGPGESEDESGLPFQGPAGELLQSLVKKAGLDWDDAYVTNIVGCRPLDDKQKNRDPSTVERDACLPRVHEIIYLVDPWIVVPVGKAALKALAKGRDWAITEHHGLVFSSPNVSYKLTGDRNSLEIKGRLFPRKDTEKREVQLEYDMIPILHPSYLLREDSYNTAKKEYSSDGLTHRTFKDLKRIRESIDALEKEYAALPKFERK